MTNTSTPPPTSTSTLKPTATKQHGGRRSGAGRKPGSGKYGEASARVSVPISAQDKVIDFVKALASRSTDTPRVNQPAPTPSWSDSLSPVELSEPI